MSVVYGTATCSYYCTAHFTDRRSIAAVRYIAADVSGQCIHTLVSGQRPDMSSGHHNMTAASIGAASHKRVDDLPRNTDVIVVF